jgi:hypothetical protein
MKTEQAELFEAKAARDAALAQVSDNAGDFTATVRRLVCRMPSGLQLTGEDIRLECEARGIVPHHHNAWGATINSMVRGRILAQTGKHKSMRTKKSHARRTPVYVVV